MAKKIKCPDAKWFMRLADGQVTDQQEQQLSKHLESCPACQATVDKLSDLSNYISETNELDNSRKIESRNLQQKLNDIKSNDPNTSISASSGYMDVVPWLDPSDQGLGRIDEFELLEFVGRGGMGIVFKCMDTNLQRHVALKLMSPQLLVDKSASQRFLREARSAAKINHPNVVTVHRVNEVRGLPYLVMEFIEGESLEERLKGRSLPFDEVLTIATQSVAGLSAAHQQSVLHRDIKPANIMLDSRSGTAKIADFGLACTAEGSNLTQTGLLVGTPDFVSPEQASGEPIDHRSDLFSLGSVLYAMCCGASPFTGQSMMTILDSVKSQQPASIESINPSVPNWFTAVVSQLLQKDPQDRYANADQVLAAINAQTKDENEAPRIDLSVNQSIRKERLERKNKYVKSLVLVTAAALLMMGTVFWWFYSQQQNSAQAQYSNENRLPVVESAVETELPQLQFVDGNSNQVVVGTFEELKAAFQLPEDSLTIYFDEGAELQITEQLSARNKNITLSGNKEDHGFIEIEFGNKPAFWIENGTLTLEHLELRSELNIEESENDVEDEDEDASPIISCHDGHLILRRARIYNLTLSPHCIELFNSSGLIEHSQILTVETGIDWIPTDTTPLTINKSLFISPRTIHVDDSDKTRLNLASSTFIGEELFGFDGHGNNSVSFTTDGNLFVATSSFIHVLNGQFNSEPNILSKLQFDLHNDMLPPVLCAVSEEQDETSKQILFKDANWFDSAQENGCKFLTENDLEDVDLELIARDIFVDDYECIVEIVEKFEGYGIAIGDAGPLE